MFNIDHPSSMAFRTRSEPLEPPRSKRPLSVIEEHLDEDLSPEEASKQRSSRRSVHNGDCSSQIPLCNGIGNGSHLRTNGVKKTRKKVVFGDHSPVFLCFPDSEGHDVNSAGSADEQKVPLSLAAVSEYKNQVKNQNQEFPQNHEKDFNTDRGQHPTKDSETEGDLSRLKDTATKLNLKTRRQSYLTWRAEYVDKPRDSAGEVRVECCHEERLTRERKERIDKDLQWIKGQLIDLRRQDQSLARQLLGIRHELSNLRLAASCEEHRDLLDDAEDHVQELRELSRFVDFPPEMLTSSPGLRHIGVTKMNLSSRRFSAC